MSLSSQVTREQAWEEARKAREEAAAEARQAVRALAASDAAAKALPPGRR